MSKVSAAKKQHRSMRGKQVDMDLLRKRNELTPAVGNARVNARGDQLGAGGKIVRKKEEYGVEISELIDLNDHYSEPPEYSASSESPFN